MVWLLSDERMRDHRPGAGNPERPARLMALLEAMRGRQLEIRPPAEVAVEDLQRVHADAYLEALARVDGAYGQLDADTATSPGSMRAARLAAGAAVAAVDGVLDGHTDAAFALVRPPGHHAERGWAMGFCLYNNVAVAAARALERPDVDRVLIVDWDVHHGNGTQHMFEDRADVLFCSTHQWPLYPGTGAPTERGVGAGEGYTQNLPFPAGSTDGLYAAAFDDLLLPKAQAYNPDLVLISAGFDAHRSDPLGGMQVTAEGFAVLCHQLWTLSGGKIAMVLEGGYDLDGLVASVDACLRILDGETPPAQSTPTDREAAWLRKLRAYR